MTRLDGRRRLANIPFGRWKIMTFIAGLRRIAPPPPQGSEAFKTHTVKALVPTLAPGDIIVMGNLPAPKVSGVTEIIAKPTA